MTRVLTTDGVAYRTSCKRNNDETASFIKQFLRPLAALVLLISGQWCAAEEAGIEFFEKRIRPILADRCYKCHSAETNEIKGGLRLDTFAGLTKGGNRGAIVVPGKPEDT